MHAIVISGGKGSRLESLSLSTPKALLRLGSRSLLEIVLLRLGHAGFDRVTVCIGHLGDQIVTEFGDGERLGLSIDFCREQAPLGTAAPLRQVSDWTSPALVLNCDILTSLDFAALYRAHRDSGAAFTMAVRQHEMSVPFGVVDLNETGAVERLREKPSLSVSVSSGIYVIDPSTRDLLPESGRMDMPELVDALLGAGRSVRSYRFTSDWADIGTPASYAAAKLAFEADPGRYLPPAVAGLARSGA